MSGITELAELLSSMEPQLLETEFVFCTVSAPLACVGGVVCSAEAY